LPLDAHFLPDKTRSLFERLIEEPRMRGMTLVGGSALALQIGHRMSEDLDFAVFGPKIPAAQIDALMADLEKEGREVSLLTAQSSIERFRINTGKRLLDYARDYVVDDIFRARRWRQRDTRAIGLARRRSASAFRNRF
jgi:hypothetical protein